jgi:hypothetical protein
MIEVSFGLHAHTPAGTAGALWCTRAGPQWSRRSLDSAGNAYQYFGEYQVSLAAEPGIIENYLAIEQLRFADRLRVEIRVDPAALDAPTSGRFPIVTMRFLLDEKRLAKLIPAYERFHRAEAAEEILYLAILIDLLRRAQHVCRNNLQRVGIGDAVSLETFRLLAVEQGENYSTWTK